MVLRILLAFASMCAVLGSRTTSCLDGWLAYNGSCYLFGHVSLHFTEAEHYCRQHGGHLVHVNDATENTFLKDRLRELLPHHWWLGLTDEVAEGYWKWTDDDTEAGFTDFMPNDHAHLDEDCAVFQHDDNYLWVDTYCDDRTAFSPLCEMEGDVDEIGIIG